MSDKRSNPKVCGRCARVSKSDIERKFCPVTSSRIMYNKPAVKCIFFVEDEEALRNGFKRRGGNDVFM